MQCKFYMAIGVNGQRMTSLVSWMNLQVCILTPPPPKKINSSFSLYQQLYAEELFLIPAQIIYHLVVLRNILIFFFILKILPRNGWQRMWHTYLSFVVMLLRPKC